MGDHIITEVGGILRYRYEARKQQGPKQEPPMVCLMCHEPCGRIRQVFKGRVAYRMPLHRDCKLPSPYTEAPNFNAMVVRDENGEIIA